MSATFVVTVADADWFRKLLAEGLFDGKIEVLNAVSHGGESFLRPDGMSPAVLRALRERGADVLDGGITRR